MQVDDHEDALAVQLHQHVVGDVDREALEIRLVVEPIQVLPSRVCSVVAVVNTVWVEAGYYDQLELLSHRRARRY